MFTPRFEELVTRLKVLPGVGPRSAQRMALYLLERNRSGAQALAQALEQAVDHIHPCRQCRSLAEEDICPICASPLRDEALLCVVESPADISAIEQSGSYRGRYFVLGGQLSPMDGIGPAELGMDLLVHRLRSEPVTELILATSATVEGQATAHYIQQAVADLPLTISQLAQGVPQGGELEYVDSHTLTQAMQYRRTLERS